MELHFDKDSAAGRILLAWWQRLEEQRGDRAALRRAADLAEIAHCAAYQRLYRRFDPSGEWGEGTRDRLAAAAGLVAHLREASTLSLPLAMSQRTTESDSNLVSELRFRRLLESPDIDSLFVGLRRILPLIGHTADPYQLAGDVFYWGETVRKRWAYTYQWRADESRS